jgi:hypothetical protein
MRTTFFLTPRQLEWRSAQWSRLSISIGLAFLLAVLAILGSRQSSSSITSISPSQPVLGAEAALPSITSAVSRLEADKVPPGLTASDWSGIKGEYERHRHAAFPVEGGHQARNYAQQWLTRFDGRGFEIKPEGGGWRWGLELQSYGFAGRERGLKGKARVRTETERVTYAWNDELDEWFVNDQRGLEHGFTVKQRPERREGDTSPLELRLAVRGGLKARVGANGGAASFTTANGSTAVNYSGLKVWDADGKVMPARFSVEGGALSLSVEESAARYPLTIDPLVQQAYLKASNTGDFDVFGSSVAISGETAVIGAQNEDSNATGVNGDQSNNSASNSGAAYVFVRSGNTWSQQAYLKASNTGAGDQFGFSVAISGETIVVGAVGEDSNATGVNGDQSNNSATDSGAAYVFVRSGSTWSQQAYLKASNTEAGDQFGASVAISGETIVVGALGEDSNARGVNGNQSNNSTAFAGAAYVFVRSGSTWSQQAYLKASNTDLASQFGHSIGISGEMIVIGAPGESSNATGINGNQSDISAIDAGAAYVFVRSDGTWSQQLYLKASNTEERDRFGFAVAISGETILVGARDEDSNATGVNGNQSENSALDSGAVYVFGTSCNYSIFPATRNFSAAGGIGTVSVTTDAGCTWAAVSNTPWAQITDGASGNGDGTVTFQVAANTGIARSSTIIIAGRTFTVRQGANFVDVPLDNGFYEFIGKLSAAGITLGCGTDQMGNQLYCPDSPVTREQMAAFLLRARGEFNPPTPTSQRFTDVPPENSFYAFIDRLAALGITVGCNTQGPQYCPSSPVTREQMSAFIVRALGEFSPPTPAQQFFNDVPPENGFYAFIDRLRVLGITLGCSASPPLYCPTGLVTREQMAAFLVRAFGL